MLLVVAGSFAGRPVQADDSALAAYYGFKPLEIFKLAERSSNMLAGDLNGDGLQDLILTDNSKSRLDLLIQRKSIPAEKDRKTGAVDVNQFDNHWRFEHRKLSVDQEVAALTLGDFNGDGRTDIAYFGNPDQLVIRHQSDKGEFTQQKKQRVPDVAPSQWFLVSGDLDANGMDDLVILGKNDTLVLYQKQKGVLSEPKKLMNTSDKLALAQIADLDGDGRNDLCYLAGEGQNRSLGARLQQTDGTLGPEYVFDLERPRAVSLRDIDGKPGHEILTVDSRTSRIKLLNVERRKPKDDELPERLIHFGFGRQGSGKDRDLTIADVDGDGLADVVVTDPDASRVLFFRQNKGSGLDLGTPFPSLSGADQLRSGDFDGNGRAEVVIRSGPEKTLGLTRFDAGRLTFPEALPIDVEPVAMEVVNVSGSDRPEVVFISKAKKDRSSEYSLQAMKREGKDWRPHPFGDKSMVLLDLKGTPERIARADILGDDKPEFLIFQGSKPPQVFGLGEDGSLSEIVTSGNFGQTSIAPGAITPAQFGDKKGLLVAQENFARFMVLGANKRWQVDEQFNAAESNSKIVGATVIDLDGKPGPEIALVDTGVKKLRVLRSTDGSFAPWKEIDIGDFPFKSLRVADLNGDQREDLLLFGADKFAVLYAGASTPAVKELASFESQLEKVFPTDIVAGDLNGDGKIDLAMTDTRSHYIEILQYRPESGLKHGLYFRVFEQKSFRKDDEGGDAEPREALIADVTGDGLADLILLAHDRLLVYPQDDGK